MDPHQAPSPTPRVEGARILIVAAAYYRDIVDALVAGAQRVIAEAGATADVLDAPGAFELPAFIAAAQAAGEHGRIGAYDGYVALGCVIRGETSHYDYVCGESARAIMDLMVNRGLAIGYGVLTVENEPQAWARAKPEGRDKGGEAARAMLMHLALKRRFAGPAR